MIIRVSLTTASCSTNLLMFLIRVDEKQKKIHQCKGKNTIKVVFLIVNMLNYIGI